MSCEYQCSPKLPKSKKDEENIDSYSEANLENDMNYIIGRIKELYRERHAYTLQQITTAINLVKVYPITQIYYVLSKFVDNHNMVLFDKYGRFGYLLNRGKYYEFQPIEITDERSSVLERSVPVEYKRGNILFELRDNVDDRPKAVAPVVSSTHRGDYGFVLKPYAELIDEIQICIDMVKNPLPIKSTETNWYKNASHALAHLHIVHELDEESMMKFIIYHYLDSANYNLKRSLFQTIIDKEVDKDDAIEPHILSYFQKYVMRSNVGDMEGIYIADKENVTLIFRPTENGTEKMEWKEGDKFDAKEFKTDETKYEVDYRRLNNIIGYMTQFKNQDMSFYYKDIYLKRNKKGRKCDRSGGKAPIIDMLNRLIGSKMYTDENSASTMYSGSLCVILEILIRRKQDLSENDKIFYLTPEEAIKNKITDYSAAIN